VGATDGAAGDAVPEPADLGNRVVPDVDWASRAAAAERAVVRRHLRRLAGVVPGTRIGRIRWPRLPPTKPWPWHYWWQAHLLDCLVDAQLRSPRPERADAIAAVARTVRLRNLGSWTNDYYDDVAWFGLAVQRTRAYDTDLDIQRGPFVGFTYKSFDVAAYVFNPGSDDATYTLGLGFDF